MHNKQDNIQKFDNQTNIKLSDFNVGQWGRVIGYVPALQPYRQKLLAMGLTPGVLLKVTRFAPLGDPIQIEVRGYALSLRKKEAETLILVPATDKELSSTSTQSTDFKGQSHSCSR